MSVRPWTRRPRGRTPSCTKKRTAFPSTGTQTRAEPLGLVTADSPEACAELVADEIGRLLQADATVRDRETGVRRAATPGDVAILFRTRESHREFEQALERRGIPAYVYKGLGFFDADEVKDVLALLRYLADPTSDLRAAAGCDRVSAGSRTRGSDAWHLVSRRALRDVHSSDSLSRLDDEDRVSLELTRRNLQRWRGLVDRMPPAELLDRDPATSRRTPSELRGPRLSSGA